MTRYGRESSAGSTGLGLDIARRIAESSGGTLTLGRSPHGGGAVTIGLGPAEHLALRPRRHIKTTRIEGDETAEDDTVFGPPERFRVRWRQDATSALAQVVAPNRVAT